MIAIISALDAEAKKTVRGIWQELHDICQLQGIFNFPTPHFSWFSAEHLQLSRVEPILDQMAQDLDPIQVDAFGLGIFSGAYPVLYLPVVKTRELFAYHRRVWDQAQPYTTGTTLYYSPDLWIPHITLAMGDLTPEALPCAINALAFAPRQLTSRVDNIMVVEQKGRAIGQTLLRFDFS